MILSPEQCGMHTVLTIVASIGTDASQGKGQIISNINACVAVQATIKSTLGPYGGDLLLVDANGRQTITNDGATVMKVRDNFYHYISIENACSLDLVYFLRSL